LGERSPVVRAWGRYEDIVNSWLMIASSPVGRKVTTLA
jgi:hypothetical protein